MFGRFRRGSFSSFGYDRPFRFVRSLLKGNDITTCNLETPITAKTYWTRVHSSLVFRAKPRVAGMLAHAGFTLIGTANNHCQDQKDQGILDTIQYLTRAGLAWAGTGRSQQEAWKPYIFEKHGVKVGVLVVTRLVNYEGMRQRTGFLAHLTRQRVRRDLPPKVAALKKHVDFVVVVLHWGEEYHHLVLWRERKLVRLLEAAGCDVLIGAHPHVLRGIERWGKMVAFYSLGNFLFDFRFGRIGDSGLAHVVFEKAPSGKRIVLAEFIPINIARDRLPHPALGHNGADIMRRVAAYSRAFRKTTTFRVVAGRLQVVLPWNTGLARPRATGSETHHVGSGTHHVGSGTHHVGSGAHRIGSRRTHHGGTP